MPSAQAAARDVPCGLLLLLPPYLEAQFWQQSTILVMDAFATVHALIMNHTLIRNFKVFTTQTLLLPERFAIGTYPVGGLVNLSLILLKPHEYRKDRTASTIINRLGRLFFMLLTAALSTPVDTERLMTALQGWAPVLPGNGTTASGGCGAAVLHPAVNGSAAWTEVDGISLDTFGLLDLWQLFKPLCGGLVVTLGYSTFMLPFRLTVPVQLATFAISLATWPARLCYTRRWRGFAALAVRGCRTLHAVMLATPAVLAGQPLSGAGGAAAPPEVCATSVSSMMVMALFCHMVLLILVPCAATYAVEYALKAQCLRSKGLRLRPPWAWPRGAALLLVAAAAHVALLGAWVLSELVVRGLQPRRWQCDPETEWLVRLPAGVGAT